jgi:cell division protein FtsB
MNVWIIVYRGAWIALVVMLLVAIICTFRPRGVQVRELQHRRAQLEETNRQTDAQIREIRLKQQQFQTDPMFVERTAREESGMIKSNETIFKLEKDPTTPLRTRGGR